MSHADHFNTDYVTQKRYVDDLNKDFYGKFSYPWPPRSFPYYNEQTLLKHVNQDIGCFRHDRFPKNPKIWVAGCGTNQAIFMALRYPQAQIIGSDVSVGSLEKCRKNAEQIGIKNLVLKAESINTSSYKNEFDYIISTGVVHHNADPSATLTCIFNALKKDGVIELMVYNYYHRLLTTAIQKAVRQLTGFSNDFGRQFQVTKQLIASPPYHNMVSDFLGQFRDSPDAELADALLQPVEYSYTVESLNELISQCGLEYLQPCICQFDKESGNYEWNTWFDEPSIRTYYEELPDHRRWQITNLLRLNQSPMLWFYLQRKDSSFQRKTEREISEEFMHTPFRKFTTRIGEFVQDDQGHYCPTINGSMIPSPAKPLDEMSLMVYRFLDPAVPIGDVLQRLNIQPTFQNINRIRLNLTTTAFPYLEAVN